MTWLDKLASTPAVGFAFEPRLIPSARILASLAPVLSEWVDGNRMNFSIDRLDAFSVVATGTNGIQIGVDHTRIAIEFMHRMKVKATSAGPPIAELTSEPLPYTTLIGVLGERILKTTMLLPEIDKRKIVGVGIVSTTVLDDDTMPPGIARFIKYLGRPWQAGVDWYRYEMVSDLDKRTGCTDKCVHVLSKPEQPEPMVTLKFDWQRVFEPARAVHPDTLKEILHDAQKSALEYFEELAEGNRFDEDILRATT